MGGTSGGSVFKRIFRDVYPVGWVRFPAESGSEFGRSQHTSGHVFRQDTFRPSPNLMKRKCLNPFYIRSRIPTDAGANPEQMQQMLSQSLLHQVTYSDGTFFMNYFVARAVSQSLLHQVTYSDFWERVLSKRTQDVSIPFTSGHVFRHLSKIKFGEPKAMSQSLLHQVTYSDERTPEARSSGC